MESSWFKKVERPLALIGVVIATLGLLLFFFYEKKARISFKITNTTNVLDIRKPLKDLNIYFQGEDIKAKNLNLQIFTIQIENSGKIDILQGYYDNEDIWGFEVKDGKIIETRLIDSSSEYIRTKLNPKLYKENLVEFSKIIFERGEFFILEVLIIHKKDTVPEFKPLGKIAKIDEIIPIKTYLEREKQPFWDKVFYGNFWVQIVRIIIYFFGFIILLSIIGILSGLKKAKEAQVKSNMHTVQLALEDFAIKSDGWYPGNLNVKSSALIKGGEEKTFLTLLPRNFKNPFDSKIAPVVLSLDDPPLWDRIELGQVVYVPKEIKDKGAKAYKIYAKGKKKPLNVVLHSGL